MGSDSRVPPGAWVGGVTDAGISFDPPCGAPDPPGVRLWQALGVPPQPCFRVNINTAADAPVAGAAGGGGLRALEVEDEVAIVAAPGRTDAASYDARLTHCEIIRDRVAILGGPLRTGEIGALTRDATTVDARAAGRRGADSDARRQTSL